MFNYSDISGGAARAAYRLHHALMASGVHSEMFVNKAVSGDRTVRGPSGKFETFIKLARSPIAWGVKETFFKTANPVMHSLALLPSGRIGEINSSNADVVHLHWVAHEMLSIRDIGNIRKPVVWTLHDMWAFCGAEHYTNDFRWRGGYSKHNRPNNEFGCDLNKWVWSRKRNAWKQPFNIVSPSKWLAECAKQSALMREWPISVIPNAIDTDIWAPLDKRLARKLLSLPADSPLLLFGAMGGGKDRRKGFDLLVESLKILHQDYPELHLVVLGEMAPKHAVIDNFVIHYMGHLHDDLTLRILCSAVDVMAIPSRMDNLPNTGLESVSCGTPVVAFEIGGMPDIVLHQETGYLAKPFDTSDFAYGVHWILSDSRRYQRMSSAAREMAIHSFSYPVVAERYKAVYRKAIAA